MSSSHRTCRGVTFTVAASPLGCLAWWRGALSQEGRRAFEARGDRGDGDLRPALGIHELLPAPVEEPLVILGDVPLGHHSRVLRVRARVGEPHRQILGYLAAETALARRRHLAPVVDVVLLEQT